MKKIHIVMYHYVRDLEHGRYENIKGLSVDAFRKQIDFLSSRFNLITMEELLVVAEGNGDIPDNACLLTFDDGYIDNYTYVFPILDEKGIQGSFFIPAQPLAEHKMLDVNKVHYILANATDEKELLKNVCERMDYYRGKEYDYPDNEELFHEYGKANRFDSGEIIFIKRMLQTVLPEELRSIICDELFEKYVDVSEEKISYELYVNEDQLRAMKRHGMHIGVHGYGHYWLGNLNTKEMQEDISKALDAMNTFVDSDRWVMNYPYGSTNDEVVNYIKSRGCVLGLTTKVAVADLDTDDRYLLPRLDCNDFPPKSDNYLKIDY
ncbi:polysaccharide deacetylase family protein [Butyrivibrio sp. AD3002]|uniref:polysaccharide deacetylase family protein n=1 Tax=Butyrivibrio sp. AD3002 TaxID=1280670 RepID=UPI0003B45CC4|nr:polysaccharide deacetylase family protein [Butyrivibrio sp. AD3002]